MKTTITLLAILITTTFFAQQTYIPDDNFEQALIDLGYDTVLDDYVPTANINTITSLNVNSKNIADLTGINDFIALQYLFCVDNQLTSLNISNLTALNRLYCSDNQLVSLDVYSNIALSILTCSNNSLSILDMFNNTALTKLICDNNQLTTVDVSNSPTLTVLNCSYNSLSFVDISNNSNLSEFYCNDNSISIIDASNNASLLKFYCHNNLLNTLNIKNGNNANITDFNAINNPNLTCIEVDNASYSTANWTNIDTTATFSENCIGGVAMTAIPDTNFEQALIDLSYDSGALDGLVATSNINTITSLNVSNKNILDLTGINDFTALQTLVCSNNQLTSLDISQLTALNYFDCNFNQLANLNVTANTSLTVLACRGNALTAIDVSSNLLLQYFSCRDNLLTNLDVSNNVDLVRLWCFNNQLTSLNVKNGTNINITNGNFNATNNPNLTCINVDDATWSTVNWTNIDATTSFSENCTLSVNQFDLENTFNIYPNPVKEQFTIQNNAGYEIDTISIYTMLGKLLYQSKDIQNSIDISTLSNGMYLIKLNSNNQVITKKISINK